MKTRAVNRYHEIYDILIDRTTPFGNPFSSMEFSVAQYKVATKEESINSHKEWIKTQPKLLLQLRHLKGQRLGCTCKPDICHGDTLAEMAENYEYWESVAKQLLGTSNLPKPDATPLTFDL